MYSIAWCNVPKGIVHHIYLQKDEAIKFNVAYCIATECLSKKRGRYSGWVEGARKLPRDSRESPSFS